MIDQHLVELQLLNSAVVVNRGMNGSSASAEVSSTPKVNGHPSAAATLDKEKVESKKKHGLRRGLSDADRFSKMRHSRRLSDIDSLSPEVLRALHSTFGGKLNEIRSKLRPRASSPPPSPSPPPLQESTPPRTPTPKPTPKPTPPSSPARPPTPAAAVYTEHRTFVERLADREGAYMLIAYFSAIFLSGFILLAAEEDDGDGDIDGQEEICWGRGVVESRCARLLGYVLPTGLTAIFFTFALTFFVFDVSYSLFNILTAGKDFLSGTKKKNTSMFVSSADNDDVQSGRPLVSAAGLALIFVIDLGFIMASSALLWMSKTSTVDPVHTICDQRLKLLWMLGLMVMDVVILLSAIRSFSEAQMSNECIQTGAKRVFVILIVLLACTSAYKRAFPESTGLRICAPRTFKEIQIYEPFHLCGPTTKYLDREGPGMLQCEWWSRIRRKEVPHLDLCEANQESDWPRAKRIQVYERKDVCSIGFPQCEWPLVKQIQPYEDKYRCAPRNLFQCEWPWVKQIQLYEHEERCQAKEFSLQQCEWPWLKQMQLFEAQDRCPLKNPFECDWPFMKQIQLFESEDSFSSRQMCQWRQQSH